MRGFKEIKDACLTTWDGGGGGGGVMERSVDDIINTVETEQ